MLTVTKNTGTPEGKTQVGYLIPTEIVERMRNARADMRTRKIGTLNLSEEFCSVFVSWVEVLENEYNKGEHFPQRPNKTESE